MILKYDLSQENIALLALPSGEEICYCVPFDIDEHGNFLNNSYVVATKKRIIVLSCGARKEQYLLSDCEKVASEPQIDCGLFIVKTDGEVIFVDNPSHLPAQSEIEHMEEPIVHADIYSPPDYLGQIMDLCRDKRGIFEQMTYLDANRVKLEYRLPLNEIIFDFFDKIKSRTRGYASFDYEIIGYEKSKLVKLDMLLNGDVCDALSIIVHESSAYNRGRTLCENLKDAIPRQLFEIPVQAAVGGKIIARETVKAMRKDVLAKCYGGDITRKKKLLEKQKEGKKKMRTLGTVQLPTEAFMAVLKLDEE